jgi:hypothetical protein
VPGSFISARAVGGGRPIVVMLVGRLPCEKHTAEHRKNIVKHRRVERPTGRRREGEECKIRKKPWLMHLRHPLVSMISSLKMSRLSFLAAIFAVKKVWLWSISHDGAMGEDIQNDQYQAILSSWRRT